MLRARTGFDAVVLGDGIGPCRGRRLRLLPGSGRAGSETAGTVRPGQATSGSRPRASTSPARSRRPSSCRTDRRWSIGGLNDVEQPFSSTKQFETAYGDLDGRSADGSRRGSRLSASTLPDGAVLRRQRDRRSVSPASSWIRRPAPGGRRRRSRAQTRIDDMVSPPRRDGPGSRNVRGRLGPDTGRPSIRSRRRHVDGRPGTRTVRVRARGPARRRRARDRWKRRRRALGRHRRPDVSGPQVRSGDRRLDARSHRCPRPDREPQVVLLADGRVLVAGGSTGDDPTGHALRSTELYDPASDRWVPGADLLEARYGGHALALSDGSVLILGGANDFNTEGDTPWCPTPLVTTERLAAAVRSPSPA